MSDGWIAFKIHNNPDGTTELTPFGYTFKKSIANLIKSQRSPISTCVKKYDKDELTDIMNGSTSLNGEEPDLELTKTSKMSKIEIFEVWDERDKIDVAMTRYEYDRLLTASIEITDNIEQMGERVMETVFKAKLSDDPDIMAFLNEIEKYLTVVLPDYFRSMDPADDNDIIELGKRLKRTSFKSITNNSVAGYGYVEGDIVDSVKECIKPWISVNTYKLCIYQNSYTFLGKTLRNPDLDNIILPF